MSNEQIVDNIIEFLINNPTVECVEWKDLKIYEQNKVWYADHMYITYGDPWEEEDDYINVDVISSTLNIVEFKNDILKWVNENGN